MKFFGQDSTSVPLLTQDPHFLHILELVDRIAASEATVLIQGESGTGKELVAKRIHFRSRRASKRIVCLNCGALQDSLLLSELFGHEKGAFTGATVMKVGLVELADGGTLFLDEIGEMGLEGQAKILRFLQDGEAYRVGGKAPIQVDVRIVSATNRDLQQQVRAGKFREDLYYRINTVSVRVPPLRERKEDLPLLANYFLQSGKNPGSMSMDAIELLSRYSWPGNVRELQNVIERFRVLGESSIFSEVDIPPHILDRVLEKELPDESSLLLSDVEKRHILKVLEKFNGNKTKAADAMGITVKTLYNKLSRYEDERRSHSQISNHSSPLLS